MSDTPRSPFDDQSGQVPPPPATPGPPGPAFAPPPPGAGGPPPPPPPPPPPSSAPSSSPTPPPPGYSAGHQVPPGYVAYGSAPTWATGPAVASAGKRIVARIIDSLIVGVTFVLIGIVVGVSSGFSFGAVGTSDLLIFQVLSLAASIAYEAAFLATRGATLGKMAMSVKVVYQDGRALDLQGAFMRLSTNIGFGLVALVPALAGISNLGSGVVGIVSLVFLFTDDRRRTVWDRIAKTNVVVDN